MWTGHLGFSWVGLAYLVMLFTPNIIWARNMPKGYDPSGESRVLRVLERIGQAGCTCCALVFSDYDRLVLDGWTAWLAASFGLMVLYELCWARYFRSGRTMRDFYRPLGFLPVPLALLPVAAFALLGVYGQVVWMVGCAVILGVGHVGIHIEHARRL